MRPRWRKVFADLWANKMRSLVVILSISIGLFAIGMISTTYSWLQLAMYSGYAQVNPANIIILSTGFNQDFVDHLLNLADVSAAEGVTDFTYRVHTRNNTTIPLEIQAFPNFKEKTINQLQLREGRLPQNEREIALDFNKVDQTAVGVGDYLTVLLPSGKERQLMVTGIVQDVTIGAGGLGGGFFIAPLQGYITSGTLPWLEQKDIFNKLLVTVTNGEDQAMMHAVVADIEKEFKHNGLLALSSTTLNSTAHPNGPYLESMISILVILGLLVVFLSGFIITNMISALLNQQIQQIGVLKTIGASRWQISSIYIVLILVYSLIALAIAIAFSDRAAYAQLKFLSGRINYIMPAVKTVPRSLILQTVIALFVPQLAGSLPIRQGARLTIQQALTGTNNHADLPSRFYNFVANIKGFSRPILISLRNTFRRRLRLILTLITLILGGAIFIAVFNVSASINTYIDHLGKYFIADVNLTFTKPISIQKMTQIIDQVPGVISSEGWAAARAELLLPDESLGGNVILQAPPADSALIEPILLNGRWIQPGDQNAIVLNELFQQLYPAVKVGDRLRLRVNQKETNWIVVGFFQFAGKSGGLLGYTSFDYLSQLTSTTGKSAMYRVVARENMHSLPQQEALGRTLETYLNQLGYHLTEVRTGLSLKESTASGLNALTIFLLILALLLAAVGSMGLMGTMSLNVMERTREIGVLRAIGATDRHVVKLVLVEGALIGLISWLLACLASIPIGNLLTDVISMAIFSTPIDFTFTPTGIFIWLAVVIILAIFASILPARTAARLTIREVLAYE